MKHRYFRLSALLVSALMILSLGVTPVLADDGPKPINIQNESTRANHRTSFEISFGGYSRFFRIAYQRINEILPFVPPSAFEPDPVEYNQPVFLMSKPKQDDPTEVPSPNIGDGPDPM